MLGVTHSSSLKSPISSISSSENKEAEMEDEEEILIEPRFKYSRILNDVAKLMKNDAASCFSVHDKFLVIGSQSGRIYLFDHLGNKHMEFTARHHKCAVSSVSIDVSGNYLISCANDFSVSVYGIGGSDQFNQRITLKTSAKSVEIAPDFFHSNSGQKFVVGTNNLIFFERSFIGMRETDLYKGQDCDGNIVTITWNGSYIAFTNETGTRVYDIHFRKMVTLIQPLHRTEQFYSSKCPPRHAWLSASLIAIGWSNTICICGIFSSNNVDGNIRGSTTSLHSNAYCKYGQILHRFNLTDFFIAGLSYTTQTCDALDVFEREKSENEHPVSTSNGFFMRISSTATIDSAQMQHINHLVQIITAFFRSSSQIRSSSRRKPMWKELVVFGIKLEELQSERMTDDVSTVSNDFVNESKSTISTKSRLSSSTAPTIAVFDELSLSKHKFSAQLLLILPTELQAFDLIAEDTIEMQKIELRNLHRLSLGALAIENVFFLMGPREMIEVQPCSADDRIQWFLENQQFERALELSTKSNHLRMFERLDVGKRYIRHLLEKRNFDKAALLLPQICLGRKEEWETYVNEFEQYSQILKLAPVIPTKDPRLEPECYESILKAALYARPRLFKAIVGRWDGELYRIPSIIDVTIRRVSEEGTKMSRDDCTELSRGLAQLYVYNRQYEKAIRIYITLRDPTLFGIINRFKLFSIVKDKIVELMNISEDQAVRLLLDNEDLIPSTQVVNQLGRVPKLQMVYLQKLQSRGEGFEHSNRLFQLIAEYNRQSLLPFLRKNEHYKLDFALEICRKRNYSEEIIFLLGRSGNRLEALELIVNSLGRIKMAIDFCSEHDDDPELWQRLVDLASRNPEHINMLLGMAGTLVDPLGLIEKIPSTMDIPGLKSSLVKVLRDYLLQVKLLKQSLGASVFDLNRLFMSKAQLFSTGIVNADESEGNRCEICREFLIRPSCFAGPSVLFDDSFAGIRLCANGKLYHEKCFISSNISG